MELFLVHADKEMGRVQSVLDRGMQGLRGQPNDKGEEAPSRWWVSEKFDSYDKKLMEKDGQDSI